MALLGLGMYGYGAGLYYRASKLKLPAPGSPEEEAVQPAS
jgi:hypothetical protein